MTLLIKSRRLEWKRRAIHYRRERLRWRGSNPDAPVVTAWKPNGCQIIEREFRIAKQWPAKVRRTNGGSGLLTPKPTPFSGSTVSVGFRSLLFGVFIPGPVSTRSKLWSKLLTRLRTMKL